MVSLGSLWLPILVAAIACHFVGFICWMLLPHHRNDYAPLPDEGAARNLFKGKLAPGQYIIPHVPPKEWNSPDAIAKRNEGPNAFFVVLPNGVGNMMAQQVKNVLFHAVVSGVIAYLASRTVQAGSDYLAVFRVTGTAAFLAYAFSWGHQVIWFGRPAAVGMKDAIDGTVMALVTAGVFGWLWPAAAAAAAAPM
jgi:hypothetical protein